VNHLAGHALTPRLTDGATFPYLLLLVSGGHCQFLRVNGPDRFRRLGGTIDDAPGEAFYKVARLLGLPQPGGPSVEAEAAKGHPTIDLPRPLLNRPGCDMSFSGQDRGPSRTRHRHRSGWWSKGKRPRRSLRVLPSRSDRCPRRENPPGRDRGR
jgi:N6-L-threonylcarbamoyladenine synthase